MDRHSSWCLTVAQSAVACQPAQVFVLGLVLCSLVMVINERLVIHFTYSVKLGPLSVHSLDIDREMHTLSPLTAVTGLGTMHGSVEASSALLG